MNENISSTANPDPCKRHITIQEWETIQEIRKLGSHGKILVYVQSGRIVRFEPMPSILASKEPISAEVEVG